MWTCAHASADREGGHPARFTTTVIEVMAADRCEDCDIGLIEFCLKFSGKTRELFDFCVRHKLILKEKDCEKCGKAAVLDFNKPLRGGTRCPLHFFIVVSILLNR